VPLIRSFKGSRTDTISLGPRGFGQRGFSGGFGQFQGAQTKLALTGILGHSSGAVKRALRQIIAFVLLASCPSAKSQTALEFFTNQANALLQQQFGFGVTNIPIYSTAAPSNAYSSSWHYWLQAAANAYDATTPAANSPSVFRPLFGWSSNALYIVGYTNVTTDFYAQIASGFKQIGDPTITTNDNVWGIPWVVGMKGNPPAFNEYSYVMDMQIERELLFARRLVGNGQPDTNMFPAYTNQILFMSISNIFGVEAWNYSRSNFPDPVTLVISNDVSILLTNNYDWGTNCQLGLSTNCFVESWPGWTGNGSDPSFIVPFITNVIPLPTAYWSDSAEQFISLNPTNSEESILPGDLAQVGWPEHNWTLSISNNFMYALVDNRTGLLLDFVNLGGLGDFIPISETLMDQPEWLNTFSGPLNLGLFWQTNGATDAPDSPMSVGVVNQILQGESMYPFPFALELEGYSNIPGRTFIDPFILSNEIILESSWQTANPKVRYTVDDLSAFAPGYFPRSLEVYAGVGSSDLGTQISNSICSIGKQNKFYKSGTPNLIGPPQGGTFQIGISGVTDLPYGVWASTNLSDWDRLGTVSPLEQLPEDLSTFDFIDTTATSYPLRFYEIRVP
jgi:hypothetical protein